MIDAVTNKEITMTTATPISDPARRPSRHSSAAPPSRRGLADCAGESPPKRRSGAGVLGRRTRTRGVVVVACAALALTAAACSSTDTKADSTPTTSGATTAVSTTPDTAASSAGDAPVANAVTITTPGMNYDVSGALRPGVGSITFDNPSPETHMMAIARLKDGVTLDQLKASLQESEEAAGALLADGTEMSYGTPNMVGPGERTTVTSTDLQAGTYALICFLVTDDGTPHFAMGMVGELDVTGTPATGKPESDGTITIDDTAITMPTPFSGQGTFLVTNGGTTPHSFSLARIDDGATLDSFFGSFSEAMGSGKSADDAQGGELVGGVDVLAPGQSAYLTLDLGPGHYAYLSAEDAQTAGMPPQHGEFTVG